MQVDFLHDDPAFPDLIQILSSERGISTSLVEKDYWVTHVLWSLVDQGFEVWFKGGTSLSKGFGLIEGFSEDLDIKLEHPALASVENWNSDGTQATRVRREFFDGVLGLLSIPGIEAKELTYLRARASRGIVIACEYPILFRSPHADLRPFVQLEVGHARVTPGQYRPITSWVHDKLREMDQHHDFRDNRPGRVWCLHPLITLVEKLDAIARRFDRDEIDAPGFVRHYEDAARIIAAADELPLPRGTSLRDVAVEMHHQGQIAQLPSSTAPCLHPDGSDTWAAISRASDRMASWFWGERIPLHECCGRIATFIEGEFEE